jgi:hypothetical protein
VTASEFLLGGATGKMGLAMTKICIARAKLGCILRTDLDITKHVILYGGESGRAEDICQFYNTLKFSEC